MSGQIYRSENAPAYTLGHAWSLGCLAIAFTSWFGIRLMYKRREAWKDKALAEGLIVPPGEWSDKSPDFRYQM